jgi:hypothetical protein
MADEIDRQTDKHDRDLRTELRKRKDARILARKELAKTRSVKAIRHDDPNYFKPPEEMEYATRRPVEDIFWQEMLKERKKKEDEERKSKEDEEKNGLKAWKHMKELKPSSLFRGFEMDNARRFKPKHPLAQYLIDGARLFEAMATFQDIQLLDKYLFSDPPLHARRTLDQAYFWKLKTTRRRDRDQVVYRYTHAKFSHEFRPKLDFNAKPGDMEEEMRGWAWSRHGKYEDEHGCDQCLEDSKKVSRIIMVDQLWMWILDKNTIVTFFPQRCGVGKTDPSGVHQSIRERLGNQANPANHVRSVFDLALIVLDECFDTFFDRTITLDQRPQIMDMFAESIGQVVGPSCYKIALQLMHANHSNRRISSQLRSGTSGN